MVASVHEDDALRVHHIGIDDDLVFDDAQGMRRWIQHDGG